MDPIVLASGNKGKLKEFSDLFATLGVATVPLHELAPGLHIEETGYTLYDNAVLKAKRAALVTGRVSLADDSGLFVWYLGGAPGVYSQRFAGNNAGDEANNALLLERLGRAGARRQAHFMAVLALVWPDGRQIVSEGKLFGRIVDVPRGTGGFGYDPLFEVRGGTKTLAELTPAEKNTVSHRARAWHALRDSFLAVGHAR